jgi:S-adenosylmethionine:tRNA ribosyltransferase-isomerase
MRLEDFDFDLPAESIAQYPSERRGESRLLTLDGRSGALSDRRFADLPELIAASDLLVFNDTRVIKARLLGRKDSGGRVEVLVERVLDAHHALALLRASHAPQPGSAIAVNGIQIRVLEREGEFYRLEFAGPCSVLEVLERHGRVPLPPYIERPDAPEDERRYQTVYAREPGAVAAPTAGLHFDEAMLGRLREHGVQTAFLTLHVGAGTFQPVRSERIEEHRMHSERYRVPEETVAAVERAHRLGGRVVAVGTTSLRALESAARRGRLEPGAGETNLFIVPGFRFQVVDRLLTNFHLPRSTLLMLVAAFAGLDNVLRAYRHAIERHYRFFSYGDAMLIDRNPGLIDRSPGSIDRSPGLIDPSGGLIDRG